MSKQYPVRMKLKKSYFSTKNFLSEYEACPNLALFDKSGRYWELIGVDGDEWEYGHKPGETSQ